MIRTMDLCNTGGGRVNWDPLLCCIFIYSLHAETLFAQAMFLIYNRAMTYELLSELFVLALIGLSCARIFFMQAARLDFLAVVPLITLILSILNLLSFGLSVFGILILGLALLVTLWNSNALSRLRHRLVVDHYGVLFSLSSIINLILAVVLVVFIIILRPGKIDTKKYGVSITSKVYAGTVEGGFHDYTSPSQKRTLFLKKYISTDVTSNPFNESRVIVFVPGELSSTDLYEPFFVKLARDGYTVYSADFYADDVPWFGNFWDNMPFRRFALLFCKEKKPEVYADAIKLKSENYVKSVLSLIKVVEPSKSDRVFVVGDGENPASYTAIRSAEKSVVRATFDIATIPSYSTPGYGPVESTDPFLANYLGLKRDGSFYMSSHVAGILEKSIDEAVNSARTKVENPTENAAENVDQKSTEENVAEEKPVEEKSE